MEIHIALSIFLYASSSLDSLPPFPSVELAVCAPAYFHLSDGPKWKLTKLKSREREGLLNEQSSFIQSSNLSLAVPSPNSIRILNRRKEGIADRSALWCTHSLLSCLASSVDLVVCFTKWIPIFYPNSPTSCSYFQLERIEFYYWQKEGSFCGEAFQQWCEYAN